MRSNIELMEKEIMASQLRGSFLYFIQFFFKHITGRDFIISQPIGRESHHITLCRVLTEAKRLQIPDHRLNINLPPGYGKSTILCMWIAWCMAEYPDSNFLYISYSFDLAVKHTAFIKTIMESRMYKYLFDVHLKKDSRARDAFETMAGGKIKAFGSAGAITGQDAGLPGLDRFSGACIIDDAHKVDEAHSDTQRQKVLDNYVRTIRQRPRGINVPIINIGQRVHEGDLADFFIGNHDITPWYSVILKALDDADNALYPEIDPKEKLHALMEKSPYVFAGQFQQNPSPAGGGLFRPNWMLELDEEPKFLMTFITADTAETEKNYNDPTALSFLGLYEIEAFGRKTGKLGLHWIDCVEEWVEPKDLQNLVMGFWTECSRHTTPPFMAAIEKKSTGVTLISILDNIQGIEIRDVQRSIITGGKTIRFIEMQPYIASKRVTFTKGARHVAKCKLHMEKITANNSHRHDDICFIAGTKISTLFGDKNIEDIKKHDRIITPFGICKVTASGKVNDSLVINRVGLTGTLNHPIFYNNKFLPLDTIYDADKINKLSLRGLLKWQYLKSLNSMVLNTGLRGREGIISASQIQILDEKILKDFIFQFMSFIQERKFLKGISFIIKTIIHIIMTLAIWNVYQGANIFRNMQKFAANVKIQKKNCNIWRRLGYKLSNGIRVMKVVLGIDQMQRKSQLEYSMSVHLHVNIADQHLLLEDQNLEHVQMPVGRENIENEKKPVYNLTVQTDGVYYANGILVSNCDTLYDGIKIALIDKSLHGQSGFKSNESADEIMNIIGNQMNRTSAARAQRNELR